VSAIIHAVYAWHALIAWIPVVGLVLLLAADFYNEIFDQQGWKEWEQAMDAHIAAIGPDNLFAPSPPSPPNVMYGNKRKLWNKWRAADAARRLGG
jgi:hypothetical protein